MTQCGLDGKSVLVTGGASGIGLAAVLQLARSGANVTIADISESSSREEIAKLDAASADRIQFVHTDVSREDSVRMMVERSETVYGKLDGAINCAGVAPVAKALHEMSAEEWDRATGVNLRGMFFCLKYQIPALRRAGGGSIVTISSTAAEAAAPLSAEYCAAKAGVTGLTRAAAIDYAANNIRVNCIMPGATLTPMFLHSARQNPLFDKINASVPLGRVGNPSEIAAGAVWLVSDRASYVSGVTMAIDGALLAGN